MKLLVRAGSVTVVETIGSEPGEVQVRFVVPFYVRWLAVGVIVMVNVGERVSTTSVTT